MDVMKVLQLDSDRSHLSNILQESCLENSEDNNNSE